MDAIDKLYVARKKAQLEFQGRLMKVSYPTGRRSEKSPADDWIAEYRMNYDLAWRDAVRALPREEKVYVGDALVGAKLTPQQFLAVEKAAWDKTTQDQEKRRAGRRGQISEFTNPARLRMMRMVARLDLDIKGLFVTLTYREDMTDHVEAKRHLDYTLRWIKRRLAGSAVLWRMEYQDRGAIHFHLVIFGASYLDAVQLTGFWQKLTGDDSYPDVRRIRNRKMALRYVAKYVAKLPPVSTHASTGGEAAGFISEPYSDRAVYTVFEDGRVVNTETGELVGKCAGARQSSQPEKQDRVWDEETGRYAAPDDHKWVGRFWGVVNRKFLPYADLDEIEHDASFAPLADLARAARRFWKGMSSRCAGFTLFCDAPQWARYWRYLASQDWLSPVEPPASGSYLEYLKSVENVAREWPS